MGDYVDKSVQTDIEGLTRDPAARPAALIPRADTNTPPDEMAIDKLNLPAEGTPSITRTLADERNTSPSLLLKRKKRPPMVARISLPASEFDSDNPRSPPPTHAVFSPLPAANTLHAGHTPIIPRALSPLQHNDTSSPATPEQEEALSGPLTLPPQPGDGADDTIPLNVLDAELEKLRIEQEMEEQQNDAVTQESIPGPAPAHEDEAPLSRITSAEPRRTSEVNEVVDGILLKKQRPINFGAPMGEA